MRFNGFEDDASVRCEVRIVRETDRALLVEQDGRQVWIPLSQIVDRDGESVTIPGWLAEERELEGG